MLNPFVHIFKNLKLVIETGILYFYRIDFKNKVFPWHYQKKLFQNVLRFLQKTH